MTRTKSRTPGQAILAQNLKQARKLEGLRQVDIEARSGIAYRHYQDIETGRVNASLETLTRLAKCLKTTVASLVRGI